MDNRSLFTGKLTVQEMLDSGLRRGGDKIFAIYQHADGSREEVSYRRIREAGERLLERQEAEALYRDFGKMWERLPDTWRTLVLSSHTEFERSFGHQAKKKRKLYNGMIKCDLFMYGNV